MATKDERIVVRMPADLKDWIHAEADAIGIDDAAFVRMVLLQCKRYGAPPRVVVPEGFEPRPQDMRPGHITYAPQPVPAPIQYTDDGTTEPPADGEIGTETPLSQSDIDALVQQQVAEADAKGLTCVARPDPDDEEPHQLVRGLHQVKREPGKAWANRYAT